MATLDRDTAAARAVELPSRYDARAVEPRIYERWLAAGIFTPARDDPGGARFVVIMPPPNVTGSLHMGHALTATVEDVLVRYHRARGDDTVWLPGVDHASIAAQYVLDRILEAEGETRESLGRERYLDRMHRYMDETRGVITRQHHKIGASADWSRERFTMDDGSARAVRVAFKRLWDAGLIYRGEALITWCPRCRTSISDLENVHRDEIGTLWTIRYPLVRGDGTADPDEGIAIATTRPETLLGDVAVAVHPDDDRYRALVGRDALLPFLGRRLPIVADDAVDPAFGTGAVKITPAHDPDDYELGRRHGLPAINVLDEEARMNEQGGPFAGLDRFDARSAVVDQLRTDGALLVEEPHRISVGRCDRCDTITEPRLSTQWFVRTGPLAGPALAAVREGRTRIVPERFAKVYIGWLQRIRDWNISRQLWWGHRIPAWFCPDGHITVTDAETGPNACAVCDRPASELRQEEDILDTWFSSGLWPFSTLGWPDRKPDFVRFYPTTLMETGYDILFFWVVRMMLLGLFCTGTEPFATVYLHGLVRDPYGKKMSKTRGNTVDPLQVIDDIGADALRYALLAGTGPGSDQRLSDAKLDGARNFTNKLWNAARFLLANAPGAPAGEPTTPVHGDAPRAERWIRSRLADLLQRSTERLDGLAVSDHAQAMHDAVWSDYCDRFLELVKVDLRGASDDPGRRARIWRGAADVFAGHLRLLHPVMPFVTERVWAALAEAGPDATSGEPLLAAAAWPEAGERDPVVEAEMEDVFDLIRRVRALRSESGMEAAAWLPLAVAPVDARATALLSATRGYIEQLAHVRPLTVETDGSARPADAASAAATLGTAWIGSDAVQADEAERRRSAERDELARGIDRLRALLADERFTTRAPGHVVQRERARLRDLEERIGRLTGPSSG
ncbi:MAG: valine--tRNA ligase [Chloroflexota bacterium]|nr:valine--tRNA ligase [Chloroflexota bacterium]